MNKILKKYFRNSEVRVVHCNKEFIVQKERKINFESNNHAYVQCEVTSFKCTFI